MTQTNFGISSYSEVHISRRVLTTYLPEVCSLHGLLGYSDYFLLGYFGSDIRTILFGYSKTFFLFGYSGQKKLIRKHFIYCTFINYFIFRDLCSSSDKICRRRVGYGYFPENCQPLSISIPKLCNFFFGFASSGLYLITYGRRPLSPWKPIISSPCFSSVQIILM